MNHAFSYNIVPVHSAKFLNRIAVTKIVTSIFLKGNCLCFILGRQIPDMKFCSNFSRYELKIANLIFSYFDHISAAGYQYA